jgi:hypothetical protein
VYKKHVVMGRRSSRFTGAVAATAALVAVVALASAGRAYDRYSENRDATNCRACHGDFRAANYRSAHDQQLWVVVDGGQTYTSLHDVHRRYMVSSDCDTCHSAQRFPVFTRSSNGGTGFDPIGCAGCHGRSGDENPGTSGYGAGLRQHHDRNGVHLCRSCHADADPATYTPVAEAVPPPYYFTPDPGHPNKPTDPCNTGGIGENIAGGPEGLDNDGNDVYDQIDCSTLFTDGFETGDTSRWSAAVP